MFQRLAKAVTVFWLSLALMAGKLPLAAKAAAAACGSEPVAAAGCACAGKCGCCLTPHESPAAPAAPALPAPAQQDLVFALPASTGSLTTLEMAKEILSSPASATLLAVPVPIYQRDCSYLI